MPEWDVKRRRIEQWTLATDTTMGTRMIVERDVARNATSRPTDRGVQHVSVGRSWRPMTAGWMQASCLESAGEKLTSRAEEPG